MNPTSFTILIFNYSPEYMQMYKIPDDQLTATDIEMLEAAHGKMINHDDSTEAMDYVYGATLTEEDCQSIPRSFRTAAGKFIPFLCYSEIEDSRGKKIEMNVCVSRIISMGFML